ncbi:MAG: penicillin-binding protein 2 [Vicinamibacterales bacterium]
MTSPVQHEERHSFSVRLTVMKAAVILVFSTLAVAFWWLQVARHEEFAAKADANHIRTITLRAPRGVLFDRDGQIMVVNQEIQNISILREQTENIDETLARLAEITGADLATMKAAIAEREKEPIFRPIPVIENATRTQVARVKARLIEIPAVIVQDVPTRKYPDDRLAAHLFGYVGEVNEQQLARPEFATLSPGDIVGHSGIELALNSLLMGMDGARYVVVDSKGREIEHLEDEEQAPVDGQRVKLTIDLDMQKALEDAFRHYKYWGAAAFIDPNTGDVLAMTSLPAYDPNAFAVGIDQATWTSLNKDPLLPLTNRLIQGTFPPGSTFKILMAVIGLQEKLITPQTRVHCSGGGVFWGRPFQCHRVHGTVDLRHAIEQSCNVYFYTIGQKLGDKIDIVHKWGERLGLVGKTGIDLPNEVPGFIASSEWAKKTRKDGKWYPGETISVAIGQGAVAVTPMNLAMFAATIANGGTLFKPNLLKEVFDGKEWKSIPRPEPKAKTKMDPEHVKAIREGMWMVVNGAGTGGRARMPGYDVAGKTGTAQANISLENRARLRGEAARRFRDHGWWIFFAPQAKPEVAGVVFTENSEHGYLSAPIAKHVLETYFAKKEKRPLPKLVPEGTPTAPVAPAAATGTATRPAPGTGGHSTPSGRSGQGTGGR